MLSVGLVDCETGTTAGNRVSRADNQYHIDGSEPTGIEAWNLEE